MAKMHPSELSNTIRHDFRIQGEVCERLLVQDAEFSEAVAFHAQQAVEKSVKALLVARQVEFPKTHDIERLLELVALGDGPLAEALADAAELTPFGVEYRYPGEYVPVTAAAGGCSAVIARGTARFCPSPLMRCAVTGPRGAPQGKASVPVAA